MPTDPSIPLQLNNEPFQRGLASLGDSLNPVSQYTKLMGLQNLSNESQLGQLKLKSATQADADEQKWRDAYQQSGGDTAKLATLLSASGVSPKLALESNKLANESKKANTDLLTSNASLMKQYADHIVGLEAPTKADLVQKIISFGKDTGQDVTANIRSLDSVPDNAPPDMIKRIAFAYGGHAQSLMPKPIVQDTGKFHIFGTQDQMTGKFNQTGQIQNTASPNTEATNETNKEIFGSKQAVEIADKNRPQIKVVDGQKITTTPYPISAPGLLPLEPRNPMVNGALNQGLSQPQSQPTNTLDTLIRAQSQRGSPGQPIVPGITGSYPANATPLQSTRQGAQQAPAAALPAPNQMAGGTVSVESIPDSAKTIDRKRADAAHIDSINNALKSISSLQANDNQKINDAASVSGRISSHIPFIDTDSKAGRAELSILQGAARSLGVQMLKGTGSVSNAEGAASANAFANLDPDKVPKEMLAKQVQNFKELLLSQRERFLSGNGNQQNNNQNLPDVSKEQALELLRKRGRKF